MRELGEHQLYRRRRKKRDDDDHHHQVDDDRQFIGPAGDGLLKALFGVAYTNDVDNVKHKLNSIDSRLSTDINNVRSQSNNLKSSTREIIQKQTAEIRKMETLAGRLERKVIVMETNPFMKTSISDLVHVRNEAYKKLALEADLAEEKLVEIESVVTALGSGKLSKSVISPKKLRITLKSIETQLPQNFSLLFSADEALWPYYSTLGKKEGENSFQSRFQVCFFFLSSQVPMQFLTRICRMWLSPSPFPLSITHQPSSCTEFTTCLSKSKTATLSWLTLTPSTWSLTCPSSSTWSCSRKTFRIARLPLNVIIV